MSRATLDEWDAVVLAIRWYDVMGLSVRNFLRLATGVVDLSDRPKA